MSIIDVLILLLIAFSVVISLVRGFFQEAVNLATWLAAILITLMLTRRFASLLPQDSIEIPEARFAISAITLFISTMIVGGVFNFLLQKILNSRARGKLDIGLAVGFGVGRGVLIVTLLVLMANLLPAFKQENWWVESAIIPPVQKAAQSIHAQLPRELAKFFDFSPKSS